jgi:hypothetical protein
MEKKSATRKGESHHVDFVECGGNERERRCAPRKSVNSGSTGD